MSLMYLARLTRPDILLPVSYLATNEDWEKIKLCTIWMRPYTLSQGVGRTDFDQLLVEHWKRLAVFYRLNISIGRESTGGKHKWWMSSCFLECFSGVTKFECRRTIPTALDSPGRYVLPVNRIVFVVKPTSMASSTPPAGYVFHEISCYCVPRQILNLPMSIANSQFGGPPWWGSSQVHYQEYSTCKMARSYFRSCASYPSTLANLGTPDSVIARLPATTGPPRSGGGAFIQKASEDKLEGLGVRQLQTFGKCAFHVRFVVARAGTSISLWWRDWLL